MKQRHRSTDLLFGIGLDAFAQDRKFTAPIARETREARRRACTATSGIRLIASCNPFVSSIM